MQCTVNYSGTFFCPLKINITHFPDGFRKNPLGLQSDFFFTYREGLARLRTADAFLVVASLPPKIASYFSEFRRERSEYRK